MFHSWILEEHISLELSQEISSWLNEPHEKWVVAG
uniref:Uncharacterized protein n=1 Tax=Anguilla anguilla TaxID=7936 RepID=A0A0E9PND2_ANGAN